MELQLRTSEFSQSVLGFGSVWLWKFAGCKGAMFKGWRKRTYKLFFYIVGIAPLHLRIFLIYFLGLWCLWKDCIIFVPIVGIAASHFWIFSVCFGFWIRVIVKICRVQRCNVQGWRKRTYKLFFYIVGIAPLHLRIFLIYFLGLCCLWKDCIVFVPIVGIAASHFWIFSVCFGFWIRVIVKICREDREPRIERWKLRVGSGGWSSRGGFVCEWAAM